MKRCPECGRMSESKFCPDCGFNLSELVEFEQAEENTGIVEHEMVTNAAVNPELTELNDSTEETVNYSGSPEEVIVVPDSEEEGDVSSPAVASSPESEPDSSIDTEIEQNTDKLPVNAEGKKKKKTGLIIGGIAAALAIIVIVVISNQPKLVSIDADYNGPSTKGTVVNNDSSITVTGTYDDDSEKEVSGWTVDETTIEPGFNDITVTYEDKTADISVYCPLMTGGKYTATVDEIKSVLYSNNTRYVEGFTGFTKDTEIAGKYDYEGSTLDLSVSFTKRSGSENVAAEGSEIPDAAIVTILMRSADFSDQLDNVLSAGASLLTTVDPEITYDDAYAQIKQCTSDTVANAEGISGTDDKKLDNLDLSTGMLLANGNLMVFYSCKAK